MTSTYEKIATTTLGSNTASYEFTSIPQTYTDLVIIIGNATTTVNTDGALLGFNGVTTSQYSYTYIYPSGGSVLSTRQANMPYSTNYLNTASLSDTAPSQIIINIMNYSNTTTYKTSLTRPGSAPNGTEAWVHLWRNTAAITSVKLGIQGSDQWKTGTMFTMYGIKAE
jgi:hypothetical protein